MANTLRTTLAAAVVTAGLGTTTGQAMTNSPNPDGHQCPGITDLSVTETWEKSKARATLIDNNGSQARIERGKTYAAFMDAFWQKMEKLKNEAPAQTVGKVFDHIQLAYIEAQQVAGQAISDKGVSATVFIQGTNKKESPYYTPLEFIDLAYDVQTLEHEKISDDPKLISLLDGARGIDIGIRFMRDGMYDYIVQPISYDDMFKGYSARMHYTAEIFQYANLDNDSYWDDANLTDGIVCQMNFAAEEQPPLHFPVSIIID